MNGPYFRDYHPLLDQRPDVGGTARSAEHAEQRAASTRKTLPLETMTALVLPASGEACTTKVQLSANYRWYSFSGSPSQRSLVVDPDFDWGTAMRGPCVND
jgi:hypothetical protein